MQSQAHPMSIPTVFKLWGHIISKFPSVCEPGPCCDRFDFVADASGEQGRLGLRVADVNCVRWNSTWKTLQTSSIQGPTCKILKILWRVTLNTQTQSHRRRPKTQLQFTLTWLLFWKVNIDQQYLAKTRYTTLTYTIQYVTNDSYIHHWANLLFSSTHHIYLCQRFRQYHRNLVGEPVAVGSLLQDSQNTYEVEGRFVQEKCDWQTCDWGKLITGLPECVWGRRPV